MRPKIYSRLFRVFSWVPLGYLAYRTFQNDLGAQPAETLNRELGEWCFQMYMINLAIGLGFVFFKPFPRPFTWILKERRYLGLMTFLYLVLHIAFYYVKEADLEKATAGLLTYPYLTSGAVAALIIFILALTSNNFSVRKLGGKTWKKIHRFVYLSIPLVGIHLLLFEKGDRVKALLYMIPLMILQMIRAIRFLKARKL